MLTRQLTKHMIMNHVIACDHDVDDNDIEHVATRMFEMRQDQGERFTSKRMCIFIDILAEGQDSA